MFMEHKRFHGPEVREGKGPYGGHGGRHGPDMIGEILERRPDAQILFIGSVNCLRHKPFFSIAGYMQQGKAALLCPAMADFASGRYLRQVKEAIKELSEERGAKHFALIYACQWLILSSDGELLKQEVLDELGVELTLWDDSHLENGDHN